MQTLPRKRITKNGVYPVNNRTQSPSSSVLLSGEAGGAVAAWVIFPNGVETAVVDADDNPAALVINTQDVINNGIGNTVYLKITGATGLTNLTLEVYPQQ